MFLRRHNKNSLTILVFLSLWHLNTYLYNRKVKKRICNGTTNTTIEQTFNALGLTHTKTRIDRSIYIRIKYFCYYTWVLFKKTIENNLNASIRGVMLIFLFYMFLQFLTDKLLFLASMTSYAVNNFLLSHTIAIKSVCLVCSPLSSWLNIIVNNNKTYDIINFIILLENGKRDINEC